MEAEVYIVFRGKRPGIYNTWEGCETQINNFPDPLYRPYASLEEAELAWDLAFPAPKAEPALPLDLPIIISGSSAGYNGIGKEGALKRSSSGVDFPSPDAVKKRRARKSKGTKAEEEVRPVMSEAPRPEVPEVHEPMDGEIRVILTAAQQAVVDMAEKGDSIFLTGAAGSGKTATLKEILRCLEQKYPCKNKKYPTVQVTAPTGIAALPLKGKTTWSFAGWNMNSFHEPLDNLIEGVKMGTTEAMGALRVLVIEEISMVENHFLERLDQLMRKVLQSPDPFGGKQVIFVGDFHQLPPVKPFENCMICGEPMDRAAEGPVCTSQSCPLKRNEVPMKWGDKWAFKAPVWAKLQLKHVKLEQIHRQKDTGFQSILNKIRNGITLDDCEWKDLERKKESPKGITPIRLMSLVNSVRNFNASKLGAINSPLKLWTAHDICRKLRWTDEDKTFRRPEIERKEREHLASLKDHRFQTDLTLKVGAKVVLLYNLDIGGGLVNGTQGEVVGFVDTKNWSSKELEDEDGKWRFERVVDFTAENSWRPIVRFANGRQKAIPPIASQSLRGASWDRYRVCRTQIPLTLGWALSIHKSQGMTLEYVELSSKDIFETGQLYVGLSRATTLQGLTVTGLNRKVLEMDPDVLAFYEGVAKWVDLGVSNRPVTRSVGYFGASGIGGGGQMGSSQGSVAVRRSGISTHALSSQALATSSVERGAKERAERSLPSTPAFSSQVSVTSKIEIIDLTGDN